MHYQASDGRPMEGLYLRLPHGLRDQIRHAAAKNHRSMNAEVAFHLDRIFGEAARTEATAQNE
jgi:plasmid stability protein